MKNKIIFFSTLLLLLFSKEALAADYKVWFNFESNSYIPPSFSGKNIPAKLAEANVFLEVLKDGRPLDLSKNKISWYLNNSLKSSAVGQNIFNFKDESSISIKNSVRAIISGVKEDGGSLTGEIDIPISAPLLILTPPAFLEAGKENSITATPFFFNVSSLNNLIFSWRVNSEEVLENSNGRPDALSLFIEESSINNQPVLVSVSAVNKTNILEKASVFIKIFKKQ